MRHPSRLLAAALIGSAFMVSISSAATVHYKLDLSVPGAFTLTAQASLGDNSGIATYGVPLTGSVLTLDHRTPNTLNLNNFQPAGFTALRSADGSMSLSASQALGGPNQISGFGQEANNWVGKGISPLGSPDATSDAAWLVPIVIAQGTWSDAGGNTLGFNNASADLLASVYGDSSLQQRVPAEVTTEVFLGGPVNTPPTVDPEPADLDPPFESGSATPPPGFSNLVTTTFTGTDAQDPPAALVFSNAVLSNFVPLFPGASNPAFNGTVAANGAFSWNTTGFARGLYQIDVTVTDTGGLSASGGNFLVTIDHVPEPSTFALIGLALVGMIGIGRRGR